jgi:hypothetical protein
MMKKVLVVLLTLCFLFVATTAYAADYAIAGGIPANGNVKTTIKTVGNQGGSYEYMLVMNGRVLNINKTKIYMSKDEIMVPIRDILKGMGFQVRWHGLHRTITAHRADIDFFSFEVDQDGIEMRKGTAHISLELLEEILDDEDVDFDIVVDKGATFARGNRRFSSVGVITVTGGIYSHGWWDGDKSDDPDDPDEDSMTGFITRIFDEPVVKDLADDLTNKNDDEDELIDAINDSDLNDLVGAIELDDETIFLVDEKDTMIELLDEADAEFNDLREGMWVKVSYQDEELLGDIFIADDIEEIEITREGRVQEVLSDGDVKDELDLTSGELNDLEDDLFMNDTEGGLMLNGNRLFLIDTDTEILDEEGGDIDLDDLKDGWLLLVAYHGPEVEDHPETYLAKKVEVLAESMLGYITDILDMGDVEDKLDMSGSELRDLEDGYDMEAWLGAIEIDDDVLFLIGDDTELFDEEDDEIDFGELKDGLLVLVTYDRDDVSDNPETYVARMVEIREETVTGIIVTEYGPDGDETAILVDVDGGDETMFLISNDTDINGDLEEDTEVEVTYFDELLDDTPDEYAAKEITVVPED